MNGAKLGRADLSNSDFYNANLSNANIVVGSLSNASFDGTNLSNVNLARVVLKNAKFKCSTYPTRCPKLKDVKWDQGTDWEGIQGWETVENIPPSLKQQLGLK